MITELMKWGGVAVCLVVLAGCICRIDMMRPEKNAIGWRAMYIMAAPFAGGTMIDLLAGHQVNWYTSWGMATMFMHFLLTRGFWRHGSPGYTMKG